MEMDAASILQRHSQMVGVRSTFDNHWQDVAERVWPSAADFNVTQPKGGKRSEKIFDSTALLAVDRFAAAIESLLFPRSQRWHGLSSGDEKLDQRADVKKYLEDVTRIIFAARYRPDANFAGNAHEKTKSLGVFGNGVIFCDEVMGRGLRYKTLHMGEIYFLQNHAGQTDTFHRVFRLTARQAMQKLKSGDFESLPEKITSKADANQDEEFEFIHCVYPSSDKQSFKKDYRGMDYASVYVSVEGKQIVGRKGYRSCPYIATRYSTSPREEYGRSPAMMVLPDIKMVNEMSKTMLRAGQKAVDPPLLLPEDGVLSSFDLRSGALNYGGVNDQGVPVVHALTSNARFDVGLEMTEQRRKVINDAFLVTLFQILVETPSMTATEAVLRAQEKGALLAPTVGRLQSEWLGNMIEREIDILGRAGQFPPMPDALVERGGDIKIVYTSPLDRLQKSEEATGILRTIEAMTPLAQIDPAVMRIFNAEETVRILAEANGAPARALYTKDQMQAMKEQDAQAQQAQQLISAAPVLSQSLKNVAQAQQAASQSPTVSGAL